MVYRGDEEYLNSGLNIAHLISIVNEVNDFYTIKLCENLRPAAVKAVIPR